MDTKSKGYRSPVVKGIAFVLLVLCIATAAIGVLECVVRVEMQGYKLEALGTADYRQSYQYPYDVRQLFYAITRSNYTVTGDLFDGVSYEVNGESFGTSGRWVKLYNNTVESNDDVLRANMDRDYIGVVNSATIWLSDGWMAARQAEWQAEVGQYASFFSALLWVMIPVVILGLILFAFLIATAGRRPGDARLHLSRLEWFWSELLLGLLGLAGFGAFASLAAPVSELVNFGELLGYNLETDRWIARVLVGGGVAVCSAVAMWALLACVRRLKDHSFLRHSMCGIVLRACMRVLRKIVDFFRSLLDGRAFAGQSFTLMMFRRRRAFLILAAACAALCVLFFYPVPLLGLLAAAAAIPLVYWYAKSDNGILHDVDELTHQISQISGGDLTYRSTVPYGSPLRASADMLEHIGDGMNRSIQKQLRGERMKIELVTNVSHDLKTPLTSIISYIDLLSREEMTPEARDYISILEKKSEQLKKIVSDLFELSKGTSGNLELVLETLDFKRLIEQTLADMSEQMDAAGLMFRVRTPEAPVYIRGDGTKLYRVLQNVFDNALKYAMPGTRVFVDLRIVGARAVLLVKNTASYEIDFTAQDIMERFARGDKARHSEGSGLGLSIAQSFTEACGGRFAVSVEDDQFRVHISFDTVSAPAVTDMPVAPAVTDMPVAPEEDGIPEDAGAPDEPELPEAEPQPQQQ